MDLLSETLQRKKAAILINLRNTHVTYPYSEYGRVIRVAVNKLRISITLDSSFFLIL